MRCSGLRPSMTSGKLRTINLPLGIPYIRQGAGQKLQPQNGTHFFHLGNPVFTLSRQYRDC
jgi:hypothetical protein